MRLSNCVGVGIALLSYAICPVVAQYGLPDCAALCFGNAVQNQSECPPDAATQMPAMPCVCGSTSINAAIQGCVRLTCTVKESLSAVNTTSTLCGAPVRDRSSIMILVASISGGFALLSLIIRLVVAITGSSFGWDDACATLAWLFSAPISFLQCVTPRLGYGKDTWTVPPKDIYIVLQMIYASQVGYFICSAFTKLCFLSFFLRIFPDKSTRRIVFAFIGISIVYGCVFEIALLVGCKPISAIWTSWDGESKAEYCINQNKFFYSAAAVNIALDLAIVIIPIPELIKLNLSMKRKLFLLTIFGVGGITILVSCIRLQYLAQYAASENPLYDNLNAGIFSVLETNVGVMCICMPSFRRFLATLSPKCFGSTENDSKYKAYDDNTPNARALSGKRSNRIKKSTLGGSLFETQITKTVDTRVESERSDDEVQLVELERNGKSTAPSTGSEEGQYSVKYTTTSSHNGNFQGQ
ncbi:hypothetical protein K504DRAFT_533530 [Pleomassaria siparia CBS 279.74]|uniref:Uncharacterized protein n=1 Tax=Pleomassaria siparia CBS 279.74 TaxID=1314801 RepID=A0A6G1KDI6_9PLEO|nr:hypothetical protein K504DRAFT_533530 [Pleomassaria siparia CBS 279.74]